ncbi:F0F1 ATP synthase subunit B [Candidatus Neomarinimicrobiota bacterium]
MEQLVKFDPGLIFWTWTTFFIVLAILATKAWGPMIKALENREAGIRDALAAADKARQEADAMSVRYEEEVQKSRQEAQKLMAEARSAADKLRVDLEENAKQQATALVQKAQDQIAADRERAMREVKDAVVDLSLQIASKVLERNLSSDDNKKLAKQSLQQLGDA